MSRETEATFKEQKPCGGCLGSGYKKRLKRCVDCSKKKNAQCPKCHGDIFYPREVLCSDCKGEAYI